MTTPDHEWWIAQSGEYVLGTLSNPEWITFQKTALHDPEAQQRIAFWESALQPLADALPPVTPGNHVWAAIEKNITDETISDEQALNELFADGFTTNNDNAFALLHEQILVANKFKKQASRWRRFTVLSTVAGALFASLTWFYYDRIRSSGQAALAGFNTITIIRDDQSRPLWVVDASLKEGLVRATAIEPPSIEDTQNYQLWAVKANDGSVKPIGVIPHNSDGSTVLTVENIEDIPQGFAVSLELAEETELNEPTASLLYQGDLHHLEF